ncbi:ph domain protein [Neofusicoccum parvum]|uniref:Ph domain protein n=1 Tax=Neofusicoccum parvum TaxID=310453 RepID=A0ACB5S173_9PEZI|nr:ph domain protein [Neofusicoccum parvum]GME42783.1 ph domain protein [Neofusicoccum parvum]
MVKAVQQEQAIAQNIITRAMEMLGQTTDYAEIIKKWTESERMGLAWKRYDRLEWIHGPNEQKMKVHRGAAAVDENIDEGSDVDFDLDVDDTMGDDGVTKEFDDERTFELVLKNGLIIRLQAFDKTTKKEWIRRLRQLAKYWKYRSATDIQLFKTVRKYNLELLNIDEEAEAIVGQFARKWEVSHAHASPELYNLCGISACRSIHISGVLFRKPRRHATFTRCSVILSAGTLLIFQDSLRKSTGKQLEHIHHEHISTLDLRDCYLYSGLLTENDLLYQNRTFDNNKPGHTALPRIYLEDGWTSTDEDYMTCFAIWHGRKKSLFRRGGNAEEKALQEKEGGRRSRFKLVSQLGVPGNTMVFKARSRAERDHWVLAIQTESERLAQAEEVRIVGDE